MSEDIPRRFPKVASPYFRSEDDNGNYTIDPYSVKPKFQWVFDRADEVEAIEKLDGTNCVVYADGNGSVKMGHDGVPAWTGVMTRMGDKSMQFADPFGSRNHQRVFRGVQNAVNRGYLERLTGWQFGEVVGPKIQGNPHELDDYLFVPFEWLRDKCQYESYGRYDTDYSAIRDWLRGGENGIFSLFATRMHSQSLEESRPDHGAFVEGLIFVHPDFDGQIRTSDLTLGNDGNKCKELAKLRRDMFSEYYENDWPINERRH